MVKGRVRGHSKSFTNISQSFIIFALPTAAHKSTKVHESRACSSASALSGAHPSIQGTKSTDAPKARMNFGGRGMLRIEWGFGIPNCRAEALKCFLIVLFFHSCFKNLFWPGGAEQGDSPLPPSLAKLAACFYNALCTLPPPQSVGSSALAIL